MALSKTDQKRVARQITKLKRAPELGEPLGNHQGLDLCGTRRLHVGNNRVVYEILQDQSRIDILAVGAREGAAVYEVAARELGRSRLRRIS
jgi:mRNA-degrading endonuclease RelE of RelBE toxin-antitoxin system